MNHHLRVTTNSFAEFVKILRERCSCRSRHFASMIENLKWNSSTHTQPAFVGIWIVQKTKATAGKQVNYIVLQIVPIQ